MEKHTTTYTIHLQKIALAESKFNAKPCTATATTLSNLKNTTFSREEMYTPEYMAYQKQEFLVAQKQLRYCIKMMKHYSK